MHALYCNQTLARLRALFPVCGTWELFQHGRRFGVSVMARKIASVALSREGLMADGFSILAGLALVNQLRHALAIGTGRKAKPRQFMPKTKKSCSRKESEVRSLESTYCSAY